MENTLGLFRDVLVVSGTTLYTEVGDNVWFNELPPSDTWKNLSAGIVIAIGSETPTVGGAHINVSFDCECFGGDSTQDAADNVKRLLYDRIHNKGSFALAGGRVEGTRFVAARKGTMGRIQGWPSVRVTVRALIQGA